MPDWTPRGGFERAVAGETLEERKQRNDAIRGNLARQGMDPVERFVEETGFQPLPLAGPEVALAGKMALRPPFRSALKAGARVSTADTEFPKVRWAEPIPPSIIYEPMTPEESAFYRDLGKR